LNIINPFMSNNLPGQDLDLSFLNEVADGSDEFVVETIEMFLNQTPALLELISTAIGDRNWPAAATSAHKLKPNLGFFGMMVSQEMMQQVEHMAKQGSPEPAIIASKFTEVYNIVSANLVTLAQIKAEKEAGL